MLATALLSLVVSFFALASLLTSSEKWVYFSERNLLGQRQMNRQEVAMERRQRLSIGVLQARRDARIKELANAKPMIQGSLCKVGTRCGNPNCRCARGEKHTAHILTRKVRGKTRTNYVPVGMLEEVEAWAREYRRVKELMKEISQLNEQILRAHVPTSRAVARNRARARRMQPKCTEPCSDTTSPDSSSG